MRTVITLTTDFGYTDAYVAAMKGVILSLNPEAILVDLCHSIAPQNISQGAFVLSSAVKYFPSGTIHLIVVDPGVGTLRRAIILKSPDYFFIAPDNGVLSYVIKPSLTRSKLTSTKLRKLPAEFQAVAITNPKFWRYPVSNTFHGRDVMAPVAAYLSLGTPLEQFGEKVTSILILPFPQPQKELNGEIIGRVIHIDRFGNLITNVSRQDLPESKVAFEVAGKIVEGLSHSYAEGGELLAIIGSSGHLEFAWRDGSAADKLGIKIGDRIKIRLEWDT
jgi:hypothetical protein